METNAIFNYIETHLNEPLSLERLAGHFGYSKYYFLRSFRKKTGITPSNYIRRRRLAIAASLLIYTDYPILRIALDLCFESQESFTRSFQKTYGLPPGRYRNLMRSLMKGWINMKHSNFLKPGLSLEILQKNTSYYQIVEFLIQDPGRLVWNRSPQR